MDGETSMDTEPLAAPPTTVEDVQRLQKDLSSLSRELSDLDSQIELRQELASLLTEGTKEKLSKLRLKKRKRDGTLDGDRAVKSLRGEAGPVAVPSKPLCSRPLVVNKGGCVKTVRRVRVTQDVEPILPAPAWARRSVSRKNEDVCLVEFSLKVLRDLMSHSWGWPFLKPVDPEALNLPDYFSIITKPIDLGTIKTNILEIQYTYFREFVEDVRLVWKNCMKYNSPTMDIHAMAQALHNIFEEKIRPMTKFIEKDTPLYSKKYLQQRVGNLALTESKLQTQLQSLTKKNLSTSSGPNEIQSPPVRAKDEIEKKVAARFSLDLQAGTPIPVPEELYEIISIAVGSLELKYMRGLQSILLEDPHGKRIFSALTTTTTPVSIDIEELEPITLYCIESYLEDCTLDRIKNAPSPKPKPPPNPVRREAAKPARSGKTSVSSKSTLAKSSTAKPKRLYASDSSDFSSLSDEELSEENIDDLPPPKSTKVVEKKTTKKVSSIKITGLGASGAANNRPKPPPKNTPKPRPPPKKSGGGTPARKSGPSAIRINTTPKPVAKPPAEKPAPSKDTTKASTGTLGTTEGAGRAAPTRKWSFDGEGGEGGEGEEEAKPGQTDSLRKSVPQLSSRPGQTKPPQPVFSHHNIRKSQPPTTTQIRPDNPPATPEVFSGMGMMGMMGGYPNMMMSMGMMPMGPMGMGPMGMGPMGMGPMGMGPMGMGPMGIGMGMPGTFPPPTGYVRSAPPPTTRSAPPPTTSVPPPSTSAPPPSTTVLPPSAPPSTVVPPPTTTGNTTANSSVATSTADPTVAGGST